MSKTVVHITPSAILSRDALSHYAFNLAKALPEYRHTFLHYRDASSEGECDVEAAGHTQHAPLLSLQGERYLRSAHVLFLHFSGYGYSRYGFPFWLLRVVPKRGVPVLTFFHELAAPVWPLGRGSLYAPLQWSVISRLAHCSSAVVTSSPVFADQLAGINPWLGRGPHSRLLVSAVPSGIGEPKNVPAFDDRNNTAVVFGTLGRRQAVYRSLKDLCGVTAVIDIGSGTQEIPDNFLGVPVKLCGELGPAEVTKELLQSRYGFIDYPSTILGKSSILAAYTSHGVVPVGTTGAVDHPSLIASAILEPQYLEIQKRNLDWYQEHSLPKLAEGVSSLVNRITQERAVSKLLLLAANQTQNARPLHYLTSRGLAPLVAICADSSAKEHGEEWINRKCFKQSGVAAISQQDTNEDYGVPHWYPRNRALMPSLGRFFGVWNPDVFRLLLVADAVVIFGHNYCTLLLATIVSRCLGKPLIVSTDGVGLGVSPLKKYAKQLLYPFWYRFFCSAVIVPSTRSKRFLASLGVDQKKIFLTPYCSDEERLLERAAVGAKDANHLRARWEGGKSKAMVFLFVGKFIERKGVRTLIRAWRELPENLRLVMVGDGPLTDELKDLSDGSKSICWEGLVSYADLPVYYSACDILIHPADNEPWGLTVSEAMVLGKPVVVSDAVGAGDDLVENRVGGWIFPAGDAAALRTLVEEISELDREVIQNAGNAASHRVALYSSKENAEGLLKALRFSGLVSAGVTFDADGERRVVVDVGVRE